MLKFSIVITTYNRISFLRRAVESALKQTIPCEVVVVDDGSVDGTEAYLRCLSDRITYHRNPINLGHSASVNVGVDLARGTWIKLLDDDDYLASNCIEEMAKAISRYPQAAIASCQAVQIDLDGAEVSCTSCVGEGKLVRVAQEDIHYEMLLERLPLGTPVQVAFRRDAFLASGGWDVAFSGNCDDIDSWLRIACYGDAVLINQRLVYRTLWQGNTSGQLSLRSRLEKNIAIKEKLYALVSDKHRSALPSMRELRAFLQLHWILVGLKRGRVPEAWALLRSSAWSLDVCTYLAKTICKRQIARRWSGVKPKFARKNLSAIASHR